MNRGKVLIMGGSGLLGVNWALTIRDQLIVTLGLHKRQVNLNGVRTLVLNLNSESEVRACLTQTEPDIVINAAGLTDIERCEKFPSEAKTANIDIAENIARACADYGVLLVHISTDHIFGGDIPNREEEEQTSPINEYARSKQVAERRVTAACPDSLIVRTNFFGWGPSYRRSFSDHIINSVRSGCEIQLFHDVFYTPILIESMVKAVHALISFGARGTFHVVGDERISKYEFGLRLVREFGLNDALIKPASIRDRRDLTPRPSDMSLSNKRVRSLLGHDLGDIQSHLVRLKTQEQTGMAHELKAL